jgi:hypothetical protein
VLPQTPRQQPTGDGEILVVRAGHAAAVILRSGQRDGRDISPRAILFELRGEIPVRHAVTIVERRAKGEASDARSNLNSSIEPCREDSEADDVSRP